MSEKINIRPGEKFASLTIIEECPPYIKNKNYARRFLCKCDCGNEAIVRLTSLRSGRTRSCGCYMRKRAVESNTVHGCFGTRLYGIWNGMLNRCRNPKVKSYRNYGAKGITVCEEWLSFVVFKDWATLHGYRDDLTIERKNGKGNYEPSNCKWATMKEQGNNRDGNDVIEYRGVKMTRKQWSEKIGIEQGTIGLRLAHGWSVERAMTVLPIPGGRHNAKLLEYQGQKHTLTEWAKVLGVGRRFIYYHVVEKGGSIEQIAQQAGKPVYVAQE